MMRATLPLRATLLLLLAGLAAACARGADARRDAWIAEYDTIGDTVVVRTVSGGEWGRAELVAELTIGRLESDRDADILGEIAGLTVDAEGNIYAYDSQIPALRKYAADGAFIATFGRKGGGPGEYADSDGGLVVLRDGRILLRDPGNARFTLYRPDGSLDSEWPGRGGFFTSTPPYVDTAGHVYNLVYEQLSGSERRSTDFWRTRLVRTRADGALLDTLDLPEYDVERQVLAAERRSRDGVSRSVTNVPFTAVFHWTFSPLGRFVTGVGDRYAVDQHLPGGRVLRIERRVEAVPVSADEKAAAEERVIAQMRRLDPAWRWNGPPMPDHKPFIAALIVGQDGRIWVRRSAPGEKIPDAELDEPRPATNGITIPPVRYREPMSFDVFEPDGRYLGAVSAPRGFMLNPIPVLRGDRVWAVVHDDLGVNRIQRFRIVPEGVGAGPAG